MADALETQISELREAAQSREKFVAAFAHELKTPLTSIVGYADLLRSRKLDEENSFMSANHMYNEGKRLEKLSLRLLDIIILKNRTLETSVIPVSDIFNTIQDTFHPEEKADMVIDYEAVKLNVEKELLVTVLMNLAENAVKASPKGGRVEMTGRVTEGGYDFSVRDYGCGIDPKERDKITQPFYMVDKSRSRSRHGVGLGLTLCADILALHDSILEIDSTPGAGTQVSFRLDRRFVAEETVEGVAEEAAEAVEEVAEGVAEEAAEEVAEGERL
jgi:signal transduction histidine kinase